MALKYNIFVVHLYLFNNTWYNVRSFLKVHLQATQSKGITITLVIRVIRCMKPHTYQGNSLFMERLFFCFFFFWDRRPTGQRQAQEAVDHLARFPSSREEQWEVINSLPFNLHQLFSCINFLLTRLFSEDHQVSHCLPSSSVSNLTYLHAYYLWHLST